MSGQINDIVDVVITRERSVPASVGFGWANFVDSTSDFDGARIRQYGSIDEVTDDDGLSEIATDWASKYFGQPTRPTRLYVTTRDKAGTGTPDTYVAALTDARKVYDDWYSTAIQSVTKTDIDAVAAYVESLFKIFVPRSADAGIIDPASTTDVAYGLKANSYDRTALQYKLNAGTQYVDAALLGAQLPKKPGSSQWAYKTLNGITVDDLQSADRNAVIGKNANVYNLRANVPVTEEGKVASGEWLDVIVGIDWIKYNIEQAVFTQFVNTDKIEYEDSGVQIIVAAVQKVLDQAVSNKILAKSPAPKVSYPLVKDIPSSTKGTRTLPDITFTGTLSGAIIKTQIRGKIAI